MEIEEDFKPSEKSVFKKCVCGHPCPDEGAYRRHTENCRVYAAEQIKNIRGKVGNEKTTEKEREETVEQITINPQEEIEANNTSEPLLEDINLDNLRLSNTSVPSVKLYTIVPIRKPGKQEFFRTREGWFFETMTLQVPEGFQEINYLVDEPLWTVLNQELQKIQFYAAINTDGTVFLIPIKILDRGNRWISSLLDIIDQAKTKWVRAVSSSDLGAYESVAAIHDLGDAKWPLTVVNRDKKTKEFTMDFLIRTAFFGRLITNIDHPAIKKLLGQTI